MSVAAIHRRLLAVNDFGAAGILCRHPAGIDIFGLSEINTPTGDWPFTRAHSIRHVQVHRRTAVLCAESGPETTHCVSFEITSGYEGHLRTLGARKGLPATFHIYRGYMKSEGIGDGRGKVG